DPLDVIAAITILPVRLTVALRHPSHPHAFFLFEVEGQVVLVDREVADQLSKSLVERGGRDDLIETDRVSGAEAIEDYAQQGVAIDVELVEQQRPVEVRNTFIDRGSREAGGPDPL